MNADQDEILDIVDDEDNIIGSISKTFTAFSSSLQNNLGSKLTLSSMDFVYENMDLDIGIN